MIFAVSTAFQAEVAVEAWTAVMFQMPVASSTKYAGQARRAKARASVLGASPPRAAGGSDEPRHHDLATDPDGGGEYVEGEADGIERGRAKQWRARV